MSNLLALNLLLLRFIFASRSKPLLFLPIRFWRGGNGHHSIQINTSGKLQGFLYYYCRLPWHIFFCAGVMSCQANRDCHDVAPGQPNLAWFKVLVAAAKQNMVFLGEKSPSFHHYPIPMLPACFYTFVHATRRSAPATTRANSGVRCRPLPPFFNTPN
jgi:hypothetical protein